MKSRSSSESLSSGLFAPVSLYTIPIYSLGAVLVAAASLTARMLRVYGMTHGPVSGSNAPLAYVPLVILTATALLLFHLLPSRLASRINFILGGCLTASAFVAGVESIVHRRIVLHLSGENWGLCTVPTEVGHLSLIVAVAFGLLGITVFLRSLYSNRVAELTGRVLCSGVLVLALAGVCLHWLEIQLICDCYTLLPVFHMQLPEGIALVLLSLASWFLWANGAWHEREPEQVDPWPIFTTAALVMIMTVLSVSVAALVLLQERLIAAAGESMVQTVLERGLLVDRILDEGLQRASTINPGDFASVVRLVNNDPNSPRTVAAAYSASQTLVARGFSAVAIQGANRGFLAIGNFVANPGLQVDVKASHPARLLWADRYLLNVGISEVDSAGLAGFLVVQIPLDQLDRLSPARSPWGRFTDIDLCGAEVNAVRCFPRRFAPAPFAVGGNAAKGALPLAHAVRGDQGYDIAFDLQGERVLAAYGPVGQTGLGTALEVRIAELFAPARLRIQRALPFVLILTILGLWAVWRRVRILSGQLVLPDEEEFAPVTPEEVVDGENSNASSRALAVPLEFKRPTIDGFATSHSDLEVVWIQVRGSIGTLEPLNILESDLLLERVADKIRSCITKADTLHSSGQGEFVVALPKFAHPGAASETAGRISSALAETIMVGGREVSVSSRIAVAGYASIEEATETWLEHSMADVHDSMENWATAADPRDGEVIAEFHDIPDDWTAASETDGEEFVAEFDDILDNSTKAPERTESDVSPHLEENVHSGVADIDAPGTEAISEIEAREPRTTIPEVNNRAIARNDFAVDDWSELLGGSGSEETPACSAGNSFIDDWSELVGVSSSEIVSSARDLNSHSDRDFDRNLEVPSEASIASQSTGTPLEFERPANNRTGPSHGEPIHGLSLDALIEHWQGARRASESLELERLWSLVSQRETTERHGPVQPSPVAEDTTERMEQTVVPEVCQPGTFEISEPHVVTKRDPVDSPAATIVVVRGPRVFSLASAVGGFLLGMMFYWFSRSRSRKNRPESNSLSNR